MQYAIKLPKSKSHSNLIRLSGAGTGDEGEAAALKASAKEAGSLEDKQLAEALARYSQYFSQLHPWKYHSRPQVRLGS